MKSSFKTILLLVVLVVVLVLAAVLYGQFSGCVQPSTATPDTDESTYALNFTVQDEHGNRVSLSDFRGKPVVVNFWATWCGYCKMEMPDFEQAYKDHPDVQFLMVNATDGYRETVDIAMDYIQENKFTFPVVFDVHGEAQSACFVRAFPSTFFIDKNGNLVSYQSGAMSRNTLETYIDQLLQTNS